MPLCKVSKAECELGLSVNEVFGCEERTSRGIGLRIGTDFDNTRSQPSGGALDENRLIWGEEPDIMRSWSGLEP